MQRPLVIPKVQRGCELIMADGSTLRGSIFIAANERFQDILNDARAFFPFVDERGTVQIIAKAALVRIIPED